MNQLFIGVDNGVTGSIGFVSNMYHSMSKTPVKKEQSYTKKKQGITRINVRTLQELIVYEIDQHDSESSSTIALVERPLVNPGMFKATLSAMRALEATLNVLELLRIGYSYIDSKEWQKALLPEGTKGTVDLKKASLDIGTRLYPLLSAVITKQKDADGLLIAHYLMTKYNKA